MHKRHAGTLFSAMYITQILYSCIFLWASFWGLQRKIIQCMMNIRIILYETLPNSLIGEKLSQLTEKYLPLIINLYDKTYSVSVWVVIYRSLAYVNDPLIRSCDYGQAQYGFFLGANFGHFLFLTRGKKSVFLLLIH